MACYGKWTKEAGMTAGRKLTVMSANLWNLNEPLAERMRRFSDMVAEIRPDVIAMQEVRPLPDHPARLQVAQVDALAGYHLAYSVAEAWSGGAEGLAIATTAPPAETRSYRLPGGGPDFEPARAVQYARIPAGDGWFGVLNTHLAYHATSEPLRLAQAEFVGALAADLARERPGDPLLVCGDLNATPDSRPVSRLLELGGLTNPWTDLAGRRYSFASSNPYVGEDPEADSWLDYILVRNVAPTALTLIDHWPAGPASDHHFLVLEFTRTP